jgi:hypothetical protein
LCCGGCGLDLSSCTMQIFPSCDSWRCIRCDGCDDTESASNRTTISQGKAKH